MKNILQLKIPLIVLCISILTGCGGNPPLVQPESAQSPLSTGEVQVVGGSNRSPIVTPSEPRPSPAATQEIIPSPTFPPLPPTFTPIPTPTSTPINPKEILIAVFDVPVGDLAISSDDQWLAVVPLVELPSKGLVNQIWTISLPTQRIENLDIQGASPIWSPDGEYILYRTLNDGQYNVNITSRDGSNQIDLISLNSSDLVGYYWITSERIGIVKTNGISEVDLTGKTVREENIQWPEKIREIPIKRIDHSPDGSVVVNDGQELRIVDKDRQVLPISEKPGRLINSAKLSRNGEKLAYVVTEGTSDELWIYDLVNSFQKMIYRMEMGHIRDLTWHPNNRHLILGQGETGTDVPTQLVLIDSTNGDIKPLGVQGVDQGIILTNDGKTLIYGRTFADEKTGSYKTSLYQLEIKL